jgi:metallo-beta-lactamase family protein
MLSGGRILHHAMNYLPRATTRLLFVGYQAEETLGRKILNGARNVKIYDRPLKIRASIRKIYTMSSHADQPRLFTWIKHIKGAKKVFLVHGEERQRATFAQELKHNLGITDIVLPLNGQEHSL